MTKTNHYKKLKALLPRGYRLTIQNATGAAISTINKVLRGELPDSKGILVEAYQIAKVEAKKKASNAKILAKIEEELKKYAS
jgi:hypothetical protein